MIIPNHKVYRKIGAAILLGTIAALIFLCWPVSEGRWKNAALVLENTYLYALVCQGDTLYLTDADTETGIRGESFRPEPCFRTRMGVGYLAWPWGGIVGQTDVMDKAHDEAWLQQHTPAILQKTQENVALRRQTVQHVLKELEYYRETHMKDDDGFVEMMHVHELQLQEQQRLDSLEQFLKRALMHSNDTRWSYIYKVKAYVPGNTEALPCGKVSVGKESITTTLAGKVPAALSSVLSWNFGWEDMTVSEAPADTLQEYVGMVQLPGKGLYKGMLKGVSPQGMGTMLYADRREYYGQWQQGMMSGWGDMALPSGVHLRGEWAEDHLVNGRMDYPDGGRYEGALYDDIYPDGAGDRYYADGGVYWGSWEKGAREGFGMYVGPEVLAHAGIWQEDQFQGERLLYTEDRVYGIDIARYQHLNRRRQSANVAWKYLRITSLGKRSEKRIKGEKVDYPISFAYVKCTEGVTVQNRYYKADDQQLRNLGIHTGAYHFFQGTPASQQLEWFLKNLHYEKGDLPPVLDIEPTDKQILEKWGSDERMFSEALYWLQGVEKALGVKPILYVNQSFINKHLSKASAELQTYDLWVARYGEFKPYSRMLYWQLSPDGKVSGIQSDVDINVFHGSREKFEAYIESLK